jgi:flagellar motor component MotA
MNKLPNADLLGMMIAETIFTLYGFGPSQSICKPFAQQVIREAEQVKAFRES